MQLLHEFIVVQANVWHRSLTEVLRPQVRFPASSMVSGN